MGGLGPAIFAVAVGLILLVLVILFWGAILALVGLLILLVLLALLVIGLIAVVGILIGIPYYFIKKPMRPEADSFSLEKLEEPKTKSD